MRKVELSSAHPQIVYGRHIIDLHGMVFGEAIKTEFEKSLE